MMFIPSFSIFFVCLAVILLVPCAIPLWDSAAAHSPSGKSSTLPLRKMLVFQGVIPWHTIFTSPCVIPLWDSATAHSSSGKELNSSPQEDTRFSGSCSLAYNFLLHPASSLFRAQQQLTHPPVKSSTLLLRRIHVFQGVAPWHTIFYFTLHHPSLGLSNSSLNLR